MTTTTTTKKRAPSANAELSSKPRKLRTLPRTLYFAYGANTNTEAMAGRCPLAAPHGKMMLRDHRLMFRGVADVVPHEGRTVFGASTTLPPP